MNDSEHCFLQQKNTILKCFKIKYCSSNVVISHKQNQETCSLAHIIVIKVMDKSKNITDRQAVAENQEWGPSEETPWKYGGRCLEESIFSSQEVIKGEPLKDAYGQIRQPRTIQNFLYWNISDFEISFSS